MNYPRQLALTAGAILLCLLLFSLTPLDFLVQSLLYNTSSEQWLWPRHEPILRWLLYDGIKAALILFTLGLSVLFFAARNHTWIMNRRDTIRRVILSMIAAPLTIAAMKAATHVPCPKHLTEFGGSLPYTDLINHFLGAVPSQWEQHCFPAGHASGGFALLSLHFLFDTPTARRRSLFAALLAGWVMGVYKMAIGDHFLSHTVVSMLVVWLVICSVGLLDYRLFSYPSQPSSSISANRSSSRDFFLR